MRAVVQRVTRASVTVDGIVVGAIDRPGLLALVGVTPGDGAAQVKLIARKIAELRILRDEQSAVDVGAPVLVVSQFTLYADTRKGRRPTWNAAAPGSVAEPLVDASSRRCGSAGSRWPPACSVPTWPSSWSTTARRRSCWSRTPEPTAIGDLSDSLVWATAK